MPAAVPAFAAIGGALSTVATGAGAVLGGTALGGGVGGAILGAFAKISVGVALNFASRALAPQQAAAKSSGTRLQMEMGENAPASFIFGRYLTPGDLVYHNSWGDEGDTPNEQYVQVIELSDLPADLERVWINGEWATLGTDEGGTSPGAPVDGYYDDDKPRLFVRYYNGTQTVADPYLRGRFGDAGDRAWSEDMVGRGCAYAIVTASWRPEVHRQRAECRFELSGRHYDRRKDSTAGGSGSHRLNNPATWEKSVNPVVLIDNVMRGVKDPVTGEHMWGGQGITNRDLPASVWFAAANECDVEIDLKDGGTEPQFRAGLEITGDTEPATVIEELLAACQGNIAEVAGEWIIRCGAPTASVFAFTDDDIIVTSEATFRVFPGLDQAYNAVNAQYPEPKAGWAAKDAPERASEDYLAEDGGRKNAVSLQFPAAPYGKQVQRLQRAALQDSRRFRLHNFVLPPEVRKLSPLDTVSWTSVQNGYSNKQFELDLTEDLFNGCGAVALREVDPDDYSWGSDLELPDAVNETGRPPREFDTVNFAVEATYAKDSAGTARRPDISLIYGAKSNIERIDYEVRLAADPSHEPVQGDAPATENGGTIRIGGVLPLTAYEVRARYRPGKNRPWSLWMPVTTLDIRLGEGDLEQQIRDKLDQGIADAAAAAAAAVQALEKANEIEDQVAGINQDVLDQLQSITDELAGLDTGAIQEFRGIAIASLRRGWVKNPAFAEWTGDLPDGWTTLLGTYAAKSTDGYLGSAILLDIPAGATEINLIARSLSADEMPGADFNASHVVLGIRAVFLSGSFNGGILRAEWRRASDAVWLRGTAFGQPNALGALNTDWGFEIDPNSAQDKAVIFQRPAGTMDAIRLRFVPHPNGAAAIRVRVDYLDLREATEAEIKALAANGYADAAVETLEQTITGPAGAIASAMQTVRAEFGQGDATVQTNVNAVVTSVNTLAGRVSTVEATYGGNNNAKNPDFFDGARPAGQTPAFWVSWSTAFDVIARGVTSATAIVNAPTAFMGRLSAGTDAAIALPHDYISITKNARVSVGFEAAGIGSGINVQLQALIDWYSPDKTLITTSGGAITIDGTNWRSPDWASYEAPNGASYYRMRIRRVPGGTSHAVVFTNIFSQVVDAASYARATEAVVAAADAKEAITIWQNKVEASYTGYDNFLASVSQTASATSNNAATIASWQNAVQADFANFSAFVNAGQTAIATANEAQSAYVIRARAGGGDAGFGIFAWDDEDGVGSAIRLDADYVLIPGTLSAQTFVVTDLGYNKIPDDQLQSPNEWGGGAVGFSVTKKSTRPANSIGEITYLTSPGPEGRNSTAQTAFPVRPGMRLSCSYQVAGAGTGTYRAGASIVFRDRDEGYIDELSVGWITGTDNVIKSDKSLVVTPNGAYRAYWRFRIDGAETNMNVRFFAPIAIEQNDGNILITPNSITGAHLVATEVLIAASAQIGELVVGTSNIKNNACSEQFYAFSAGTMFLPNGDMDDDWYTVQTLTINKTIQTPVDATASLDINRDNNGAQEIVSMRLAYEGASGVAVHLQAANVFATTSTWTTMTVRHVDTDSWTTRKFWMQVKTADTGSFGDYNVRQRYITANQPSMMKK